MEMMPQMPGMPVNTKIEDNGESAHSPLSSPVPEVNQDGEASGSVGLNPPEHGIVKPQLETADQNLNMQSFVNAKKAPKGGIPVYADRKGFYNQLRLEPGDRFKVADFDELGEWMVCEDPDLEKERRQFFKDKKEQAKKK